MSINISHRNMTESNAHLFIDESRFRRNLWILSLFSLPVIYLGIILAVFIHEVVGHGFTAALLGGQFNGFGISLDGMGWAYIEFADLPALSKALVFFSGAFYTTVLSLLFFALGMVFRKNTFVALTFLYFSFTSLLDGLPYFFWDAIYLAGIGDVSMIWTLYPNRVWRILLIVLCGLLMVIGIILFNIRYFNIAYHWLGEGKSIKLKGKIMFSLIIFLLQSMGWFSFDWNQLIPGIGPLPSIFALAIVFVTLTLLIALYKNKVSQEIQQETSHYKTPMFFAWISCVGLIFLIIQWLQKGIFF